MAAALADLAAPVAMEAPKPAKVVGARFGSPLQPNREAAPVERQAKALITQEMIENFDRAHNIDWARFGG